MSAERSIEAVDSFIPGVDPAQLYIRPLLNGPLRPATRQECESHEQRCVPLSGGALEEDSRSAPENEANTRSASCNDQPSVRTEQRVGDRGALVPSDKSPLRSCGRRSSEQTVHTWRERLITSATLVPLPCEVWTRQGFIDPARHHRAILIDKLRWPPGPKLQKEFL